MLQLSRAVLSSNSLAHIWAKGWEGRLTGTTKAHKLHHAGRQTASLPRAFDSGQQVSAHGPMRSKSALTGSKLRCPQGSKLSATLCWVKLSSCWFYSAPMNLSARLRR